MRIAIAGFQHETNTYGLTRAGLDDFRMADSWPPLLSGVQVVEQTSGMNLPIAGFAEAAEAAGATLVPLLWCAAEPSAHVTDAAFDTIAGMILDGLIRAGPIDALYLDLHGAMVTESHEDGEGALLERIRQQVGPDLPVVISLDLHANVTRRMVALSDAIAIYRTYPHLDMAATGARALDLLERVRSGRLCAKTWRQVPYLIPLHAQFTGTEPCRGLYRALETIPMGSHAEIALGFTAADIPDMGPSIVTQAADQGEADRLADILLARMIAAEPEIDTRLIPARDAVVQAMQGPGPAIIADVQDNPGAGGTSDTTGILHALVAAGADGAILGVLHDPQMAALAHQAGVGAVIQGDLGAKSGLPGQVPVGGGFHVTALSDGRVHYSGAMYGGGMAEMGPSAVLRLANTPGRIDVLVSSQRIQCLDLALFEHIGLDPRTARIVVVKSTLHYRAAFDPIAARVIATAAPGAFPCDLSTVPYRRLRAGVRRPPAPPPWQGPPTPVG